MSYQIPRKPWECELSDRLKARGRERESFIMLSYRLLTSPAFLDCPKSAQNILLVYIGDYNRQTENGKYPKPIPFGNKNNCSDLGLSVDTFQNAMGLLEAAGFIHCFQCRDGLRSMWTPSEKWKASLSEKSTIETPKQRKPTTRTPPEKPPRVGNGKFPRVPPEEYPRAMESHMKAYEEESEATPCSCAVPERNEDITPLHNSALAAFGNAVSTDRSPEGIARAMLEATGDYAVAELVDTWAKLVARVGAREAIQFFEQELAQGAVTQESMYRAFTAHADQRCGFV